MTPLVFGFAFALIPFAVVVVVLDGRVRSLQKVVKEKEKMVAQNSKLLIEKNMELYDQNIAQQRELQAKDDLLTIASHQLRTPATEIKWGIGGVLQQNLPEDVRRNLEHVFESSKRMDRLIEALLDFVKVGTGASRPTAPAFDPNAIVSAAIERTRRGYTIEVSADLAYKGVVHGLDASTFDMAISNLIENAFHYTPSGSIRVATSRDDAGNFVCEVRDTGIGISADMRDRLFVKFRRAPEAQKLNAEGTGLGLYIVKMILERAGGSVLYEPNQPTGSIFRITLPGEVS